MTLIQGLFTQIFTQSLGVIHTYSERYPGFWFQKDLGYKLALTLTVTRHTTPLDVSSSVKQKGGNDLHHAELL